MSAAKEITVILAVKFSLLFLLWFFCFSGAKKHHPNPDEVQNRLLSVVFPLPSLFSDKKAVS